MEFSELTNVSEAELQRRLSGLREQLRDLRFKVSQGQHKDVRDIREIKKNIARIMTRLSVTKIQPSTKSVS